MARKPRRKKPECQLPLKNVAEPTLTPHERMALLDARHLTRLAQDIVTLMPPHYKEILQDHKYLSIKLDGHEVVVHRRK